MRGHHWLMLALVLIAGYIAGAKWPQAARTIGVTAAG